MDFQNEKKFLKIIKYAPSIFIIIVSLIILSLLVLQNNRTFENEKAKIESNHILKNKKLIKSQVNNVYNFIIDEQKHMENELKISLKENINNAYNIAYTIYKNNQDKSEATIKKLIIDALRNISFNKGRGYFFIYEKTGKNVLLPHSKELEGKDFWNHQDAKGTYIIQEMVEKLRDSNQFFYSWHWFNPTNPDKQREKLGIIKNFPVFNWLIGTGEYLDEFEKKIQEKVLRHIKTIKYGTNGYVFVINYDSVYLSHIRSNYIGKSAIENNDTQNISKVIEELTKISKKGEGFYSYVQNIKPDSKQYVKKTSYVKGLKNWEWIIGTGFYEDDMLEAIENKKEELDAKFKDDAIYLIQFAIVLNVVLLIFSISFSRILRRKFKNYKLEIKHHLNENVKQQAILAQQSKMASMGEMIGNIAHQWRQPLSSITTSATGMKLQKEMDVLEDKFLLDGLENIHKSAQYLSNTIDDFRNFFKDNKEKTQFNLQKTISKSETLVYVQLHNKDISIIKNDLDLSVKNYENELIQVIINLVNNAKDELIKKDPNLKRYIFIDIEQKDEKALIKIKDNAGGIPEQIKEKIFEPYFTTKGTTHGTGIGLYMSKKLIHKKLKGDLKVRNIEFKYNDINYEGAEFTITLPLN